MKSNRFEYFLNAVHYCLYLEEIWSNRIIEKRVWQIFYYLSKLFSFEGFYKRKMKENRGNRELEEYMYGKKWGQSIGMAHHFFGLFYSGYPALLSFVLLALAYRLLGDLNIFVNILISAIPIELCFIPAYKAVFTKDHYLKFFKQFEKKDEQWHKKWRRITFAFCIGSVVTSLLGIGAMWAIWLL